MASQFIKVVEDGNGNAMSPLYLSLADIVGVEQKEDLGIWSIFLLHRTTVYLKAGTDATNKFLEALDVVTLNAD